MSPFSAQSDALADIHVLIVPSWWPSPEQPLAGIFFQDYARAYAAAGARVGVIFPDLVSLRYFGRGPMAPLRPRIEQEQVDDLPVIRIRGLHTALGRPGLQMRRYLLWLRRGLTVYRRQHGEPDVLHAMCAIPAGWACAKLGGDVVRRTIVTEHTGPFSLALSPPSAGSFVHAALDSAAAVVAVSQHLRDQMRQAGIQREINVIFNPVGPQFQPVAPPPVAVAAGSRRPCYRAAFVGRLSELKGVRELLSAAKMLAASVSFEIEWHLVGDGPLEGEIRTALAEKSSATRPRIILHGLCSKQDVADVMSNSHFHILPSHGENCPLAICEALCIGRPVIGTRGTGCEELIGKDDGVLCDIGSSESLADAVLRLIVRYDQWDWRSISDRGHGRFSAAAVTAGYAEIIHRAVGANRGT